MAYRFKLKEDLRDGVRRIAVEQIEKALAAPHAKGDRVVWVHDTRKALKRTRALLRAVRDGLGNESWREENAALRQIAANLSGLRDRDVVRQTIADLGAGGDAELADALAWLEAKLTKEHGPRGPASEAAAAITVAEAIEALEAARDRLSRLDVEGELPDVLALGFARCQRVARKALASLTLDPSEENVHELRKSVQIYQRLHALAQAVWPEAHAVRVETARACAQKLGQAQDLAVLAGMVNGLRSRSRRDRASTERILAAARARQSQCRDAVLPAVTRLLALKPKAAAHELAVCWHAALALSIAGAERGPVRSVASEDKGHSH